jgi:hypothetical protein
MDDYPDIKQNGVDYFVSTAKSALGIVPYAGTFLGEIISNVIPNQRMDRVCKYLEILSKKVDEKLDDGQHREICNDKNLTLLFEKSIRFSSETNSIDKYNYYSEFIISSVKNKTTEQIQKERLLTILSELNEIEIVLIINYGLDLTLKQKNTNEFINKNREIIYPKPRYLNEPIEKGYAEKFNEQYNLNLERLGLISYEFVYDRVSKTPIIDEFTKQIKRKTPSLTTIGRLLFNFIGAEIYKEKDA